MRFAGCAPYCEGHLESDDQRAGCAEVAGAGAEGMFASQLVRGGETFLVGRDITALSVSVCVSMTSKLVTDRPMSMTMLAEPLAL